MATKGNTVLTLADMLKGRKGDGSFDSEIVDLVVQDNPMLDDIPVVEANNGTTHLTTIRTGIPDPTWVGFYEGVQPTKGSKKQVKDVCGKMKAKLEIDADLYDNGPVSQKNEVIADELGAIAEGMNQEMAQAIIYGKLADEPRAFNGLYKFYATAGADSANYDRNDAAHYVFDGLKASSTYKSHLRSIMLVGWSPRTITGFYPQGAKSGGLERGEFKKVDIEDGKGGTYEGYRQYLTWHLGLSVKDFRYGGRIANVELDHMLDNGQPDYIELIHRLVSRVKNGGSIRRALYMSSLMWENVQTLFYRKTQGNAIRYADIEERKGVPSLLGITVRVCDAMETDGSFVS